MHRSLARPFLPGLRPLRLALLPGLTLALVSSGCGGGLTDEVTPGGSVVAQLTAPTGEVRVDLPGRVSVLVRAFGPGGVPVAGLEAIDFELSENGVAVSPTESQQQFLPRPKAYRAYSHLLLDLSSSIASSPGALQAEIDAAKAYVDVVTQDPAAFVAISWFFGISDIVPAEVSQTIGGFPVLVPLGFSNDKARLYEALDNATQVEVFDDSTNLYGAVIAAAGVLQEAAADAVAAGQIEFVSKALVTFTDGSHNANGLTLASAQAALTQDIEAFSIGVGNEINPNALKTLGPDGNAFANDLSGLTAAFQQIAGNLSNAANSYYLVGYISPKNDGSGPQDLSIRVAEIPGATPVELQFQTDFFSAGGGFVPALDTAQLAGLAQVVDLEVSADGSWRALARPASGGGFALLGFDATGAALPGFGSAGRIDVPAAPEFSSIEPLALAVDEPSGALFVGGLATPAGGGPAGAQLWRRSAGGSFQRLALPPTGPFGDIERIQDLCIDGQGRVLVAAIGGPPSGEARRKVCYRVRSDMSLDPGFAGAGTFVHITTPSGSGDAVYGLASAALLGGQRTYLIGVGWNPARGASDAQVVALTESGALDAGFASGGVLRSFGPFHSVSNGALGSMRRGAVDSFGRLVIAGMLTPPGLPGAAAQPTLWRCLENGQPDASLVGGSSNPFKGTGPTPGVGLVMLGGVLTASPSLLFGQGGSVADVELGPGGAILLAGTRPNPEGHLDACWWRFSQAGLLSNSFNGTGFFIEDGSFSDNGVEQLGCLEIHPDGRLLSGGSSRSSLQSNDSRALIYIDADPRRTF
jgi:hypothetical protein